MLSDPVQRMVYDEIHGYALTAVNPFLDDSTTRDHAFVDEFSCIGKFRCWDIIPFPCIEIIGSFFSWTLVISGKWTLEHYCLPWNGARCTTPCNLWVLILVRAIERMFLCRLQKLCQCGPGCLWNRRRLRKSQSIQSVWEPKPSSTSNW